MLHVANGAHLIMGTQPGQAVGDHDPRQQGPRAPVDAGYTATTATFEPAQAPPTDERPRVVYLAACVSRAMGPAARDQEQEPLLDKTRSLLERPATR